MNISSHLFQGQDWVINLPGKNRFLIKNLQMFKHILYISFLRHVATELEVDLEAEVDQLDTDVELLDHNLHPHVSCEPEDQEQLSGKVAMILIIIIMLTK